MRSLIHRINASQPFTWQAFVWMGLGLLVFSPRFLVNSVGYQPETWRGVVIFTLGIMAVLTFSLNKLFVRKRKIGEVPWLSWSLIIGLSICFPVTFRLVGIEIFGLRDLQPGFIRFVTSTVLWTLGTLVFAVIVNETREFRDEFGRLRAELKQAQVLEKEEQGTLVSLRKKIVDEVTLTLTQSFESMMKNSAGKEIAAELQHLIDDVVRPLSSKIALSHPDYVGENRSRDHEQSRLRIRFRDVAYRLTETNPFEYKVTPVIVAFSTLSVKTWVVPFATAFLSVIANIAFLIPVLFVAHAIYSRYSARLNKHLVFIAIPTIFVIISLLDTLVSRLVMGVEPSPGNFLMTFIEIGVFVFLALFRAVPLERKRIIQELDEILTSINWMNARRSQLIWVEQQRLARLVHGDIQARILATSLEVSLNVQDAPATEVLISELRQHCLAALAMPAREILLEDFLSALKVMWAASINLQVDVSSQDLACIYSDPVTQEAVIEIIREALNNAVKHSQAHEVTLAAQVIPLRATNSHSAFSLVRVEVRSDRNYSVELDRSSSPYGQAKKTGQGSSVYEQLSSEWSLDVTSEASRLIAWVPIGNQHLVAN